MTSNAVAVNSSLGQAAREPEDSGLGFSHLFRLFVGWVPKSYIENDLKPLFEQCGEVKDIIVLKDKVTGQPRGCAFVSYATKEEAENAIAQLDRQVQLPGALCPLEVRFARSHQYIQAGDGPGDNRQLFFSKAPTDATEEQIAVFFAQFGAIEEINLFRERRTGVSKGCGFVTMQTRDQAVKAIEAMDAAEKAAAADPNSQPTMAVKWADPELQLKKKKALEDSNADNRMLFFAKVLRSATEEEVKVLFSRFGKVYDVNLFRAFQGAPTTKGCGLVTMGTHDEALRAIDALDNKFTWEGMESPMVVKWMDAALQRRRREQHLAAMRQGLVPSMAMGGPDSWLPANLAIANMPHGGRMSLGAPGMGPGMDMEMNETPPAGCAPDAIKLFVGNIPKSCSEEQLMPFFETIGKVIELVIVRDKNSHESKGSAFVWYATRAQAERAILQFNLRHVLPDPTGEQDRPLVVRKAKARNKGMHPAVGMLTQMEPRMVEYPVHLQQSQTHQIAIAPHGAYYQAPPSARMQMALQPGSAGMSPMDSAAIYMSQQQAMHGGQPGLSMAMVNGPRGVQSMQPVASAQLVSIQGAPTVQEAGLYEAYGTGPGSVDQDAYAMQAMQGGQGLDALSQQMAMSIPLNQQQLAIVNQHLFSVQTMSGAQLHISPGAPGLFHLVLSGSKPQVETAKNLVSSVLGQMG